MQINMILVTELIVCQRLLCCLKIKITFTILLFINHSFNALDKFVYRIVNQKVSKILILVKIIVRVQVLIYILRICDPLWSVLFDPLFGNAESIFPSNVNLCPNVFLSG